MPSAQTNASSERLEDPQECLQDTCERFIAVAHKNWPDQKSFVRTKESAWLWNSAKDSPVCMVIAMQLNAKGPGCKPQGANWFHVLDFCKHVLGPRLSARLPATFTDVLSRSRTLCIPVELVVPLTLGAVQRWVTNCTFICCWRKRQTTWCRCCIARSTRAAKTQITQRAASGSCPGSFHEYYWSGSVSLINWTKTIRWPKLTWTSLRKCKLWDFQADPRPAVSSVHHWGPPKLRSSKVETLGHTQFHCADAFHLTLRVEGLDAVKHYARSTSHGQVVRTRHDEQQVDASACCIHDESSILVSGTCTAVSANKQTLTRARLWAPCSEFSL